MKGQVGQNLVELALVTPLLVAMVLGAIELGRYAYFSIMVGGAAHAGALYGAQNLGTAADPGGICKAAENNYQSNAVATQCTAGNPSSGTPTTVGTYPGGSAGGTTIYSGLSVNSYDGCGCDVGGTYTQVGDSAAACNALNANPSADCANASEWVVTVSVNATATFQSLFSYPWIPRSLTVSRTATMRVGSD